jgi:hypothetical protein
MPQHVFLAATSQYHIFPLPYTNIIDICPNEQYYVDKKTEGFISKGLEIDEKGSDKKTAGGAGVYTQ